MATINHAGNFPLERTGETRVVMYSVYRAKSGDPARFQMNKFVIEGKGRLVKVHSFIEWYKDFELLYDKMTHLGFVMLSPNVGDVPALYCTFI